MAEDQGFLCHLEFLNSRYALSSRHYSTLNSLSSYNMLVFALVLWISYSRACKTGNWGDAEHANRQIDKQCVHVILHDKVRSMQKAMEVPSVDCVMHTLQLAVHEGLLSQCSVTDLPANARKVVGKCCNSIWRIRKSHIKVYTLFQQNKKKLFKEQLYYPEKMS